MPRPPLTALAIALSMLGCDSQMRMAGTPALPAMPPEAGVPAQMAAIAGGRQVTIDNPGLLPEAVRQASDLKVAFGGTKVPVSREPGGYYTFIVPANARIEQDLAGNLRVVFIMNDMRSQIVTLATGSPVSFGTPPVVTAPGPAFIAKGMDVTLSANTAASPEQYQFTWSYGLAAQGPWQPVPGQGKSVEWTPAAAGNFFIKVDAVDRASQQSHSTVTPSALVFVTDAKDVITTEPVSGSIGRGSTVKLRFNRPSGLPEGDLGFAWSAGPSLQGPWQVVAGDGITVDWLPTLAGSYFIKADVTHRGTADVDTFVSPTAVVFVNEGVPIIKVDKPSVERGDKVALSLAIDDPGSGPFGWYYARTAGAAVAVNWVFLPGAEKATELVVNEAGGYHFRVDIPQADGALKTFTTTDPVLNVVERTPLIHSVPPNQIIVPGGSVTLQLNARGIDESRYKFNWYVSTNPVAGWRTLPVDETDDLYRKRYTWHTTMGGTTESGAIVPGEAAGSYFVRVDATERTGTRTYTFTSSGPVFTIERTAGNIEQF